MRKVILVSILAIGAVHAQSPRSIMGWGDEASASDGAARGMGDAGAALRSDKSWNPQLEARSAYASLAAFEVQIAPQITLIEDATTSNTIGGSRLPRLSLSVPMGRFGHLGLGYWQRFQKSFDWSSTTDTTVSLHGEGGAFEAVLGYSLVIPGVRNLALGATYHRILGTDRIFQQDQQRFPDEYSALVFRDTVSHRYWGDYWTVSGYWTQGDFDGGIWFDIPGEVGVTTERGAAGQIFAWSETENVDPPTSIGAAGAWRFKPRHAAVAQISRTDWEKAVPGSDARWDVGAGWQFSPGGDRFDDYWRRMSFRAGLSGSVGGPQSLLSESATFGAGMPLGPLGTLDLSLQIGQNEVDDGGPKLKDSFVRLYVAITGASLWGQSQRTHR